MAGLRRKRRRRRRGGGGRIRRRILLYDVMTARYDKYMTDSCIKH
jgi:hypothetical protein